MSNRSSFGMGALTPLRIDVKMLRYTELIIIQCECKNEIMFST